MIYMDIIGFIKNFLVMFVELAALFLVISFLVSLLQQVVTEERIKSVLEKGNKATGYLSGTFLGALTPFCSCSTVPILAWFLSLGASFVPSILVAFTSFFRSLFVFELAVLFLVICFLVSFLQQVVTEERIKSVLEKGNKATGYLSGTFLGALTPFCSCSTVPILAGLLSSGAPFGPSISFLIASPLLNPIHVVLLWKLLGLKLTVL